LLQRSFFMRKHLSFISVCFLGIVVAAGCAVPRDQSSFEVRAAGDSAEVPFFSSERLRVAGLVSESLTLGTVGRLFEAESRLRKAKVLSPNNPSIDFNLAVVLGQQGNTEEAREILGRLRAAQGDRPNLMVAFADIASAQGNLEEAKGYLKNAFATYSKAQNYVQASLIARSIANLAYAGGQEQEALCYSYEAFSLYPTASDLGQHTALMVALNLHKDVETFVAEQLKTNAALAAMPLVHHGLGLARAGIGKFPEALDEIEVAQSLVSLDPELGPEVNSVWWLLQREVPQDKDLTEKEIEALQSSYEAFYPDVIRLQERPTYQLLRWPVRLRELLNKVPVGLYD
jgi:Flp pilus assembly protein TadD